MTTWTTDNPTPASRPDPVIPTMPSGQPVPRAPADPTAAPGQAPREPNNDGWGKPGK
jgi:hypothetical protein